MKNLKQIVIGIQPATRIFRLSSVGGQVVDAILDKRDSSKELGPDYYSGVELSSDGIDFVLRGEGNGNVLRLHQDNIIFKKTYYKSEKHFNLEKVLAEYREIWKVINKILVVRNIRRIGISGESRFLSENPSAQLLKNVTKLTTNDHCDRFTLHFEKMRLAKNGGIPDRKKSEFINVITDLYDSSLDTENPENGCININIDVQKFYAPLTNEDVPSEVLKLFNIEYTKAMDGAQKTMESLGLINE